MQYDRRPVESVKRRPGETPFLLSPRALLWVFSVVFVLAVVLR